MYEDEISFTIIIISFLVIIYMTLECGSSVMKKVNDLIDKFLENK